MKKTTLLLAFASTIALASPGGHCFWNGTTLVCPQTHVGNYGTGPLETYKNDIIDHTNQIDFANKGEGAAAVTGTLTLDEDIKLIDVVPRYNPTGNIGLDMRLPVLQNSNSDEFGIGDISASGNYHFGNLDSEYGTNITTLRYKASTGDENKGLGSGESSITLTHTLAKNLENDLRFHGFLTYSMNMGDVDDSIALMGGVSHMGLMPNVAVANTKFTYFKQDDLSVADIWVELSSSKIVDGVPLSTGFKIPLINEADGYDGDKTFMLYASMTGFFN